MNGTAVAQRIISVVKRDGSIVDFDEEKITKAIFKAAAAVGGSDHEEAKRLSHLVFEGLFQENSPRPTVEQIQDMVEKVLIEEGHAKTAKAYILYRAKRQQLREEAAGADGADKQKAALLRMFAHKSKLAALIGYDRIEAYKELYFYLRDLQALGQLPLHKNYLDDNELATNIYQKKYYLKDIEMNLIEKCPEEVFIRLSAFMAAVEPDQPRQKEWAVKFYKSLYEGHFLPGGRVIAGAGDLYRLKTLANCFVSIIEEDSIEKIYKSAYECARTYSYGGGIGVDISSLRPKNAVVHNAADSSTGSVSFMELFSLTTGLIGQSGRRGALMLTLDVKHPDSPHFVSVKKVSNWVTNQIVQQCQWSGDFSEKQLSVIEQQVRENTQVRFANISLKISDEFMQAVDEEIKFGRERILIYKKDKSISGLGIPQTRTNHYSYGINSKPLEKYELLQSFNNLEELNAYLAIQNIHTLTALELNDNLRRDVYGDLVISLTDYDLAIKYAGDFMLYFNAKETGEIKQLIKARDLWNPFVEGNYRTAEPGLMFWTRMTTYSPSNYVNRPILSTNPCGEVPLEDGGACNLSSINLSRFVIDGYGDHPQVDWEGIANAAKLVTRFLDNVVTWNEILNPLEKQRRAASETRRLGLGIMGIADMLNMLGLDYDSEEGIALLEEVAKVIANNAYQASAHLAQEKAPSPIFNYKDYIECPFFHEALSEETREMIRIKGLRNIALLSIAPTGTISNVILGYRHGEKQFIGVSSGIEPVFALYYTRRSECFGNKLFKVFHSTVDAYLRKKGLIEQAQDAQTLEELRAILPTHFFRTSHHIDPKKRVRIQGRVQKYVDHSISSTVNLPEEIEPEVISSIYLEAWKHGLKGITIYRDGSRFPILSVEHATSAFQEQKDKMYRIKTERGEIVAKADQVITLDDNTLSTPYHARLKGLAVEEIGKVERKERLMPSSEAEKPAVCTIRIEGGNIIKSCSE